MGIYQVNKYYAPVVGGIENVVEALATGLSSRGVETGVLAATERGRGGRERIDGVPVTRVGSLMTFLSTPLAPTFPAHLRRASRDATLLHYHLPNPLAVASHYLAGAPSVPTVVTYHSDIVRQSSPLRVYRPLLERFLDDVDRIVTTSPRLRDNSAFLRPRAEKCTVVPLGIDPDTGAAERDVSGVPATVGDGPVVLTVGRLNYYKGVSYLVEAMEDVDATLLIAGDGPQRDALDRQVREAGRDDVHLLGYVDDATLRGLYDRADVFVLPSVEPSEAFGIVQLEAMAHGLPVVNTDLPTGVPWVSRDGETGVTVPPRDPAALATALSDLLADPEQRGTYGENARARVESDFTREAMVDATLSVYESVLDRTLTDG